MVKVKLTIKGSRVQEVGYRLHLLSLAKHLSGFDADNIGEDIVVVYAEGDQYAIERFRKDVEEKIPEQVSVSSFRWEEYEGMIQPISEFRSQFGIEQLAKIAQTGVEMKGDIKEMKGDIKEMKGDIKEILVKQDQTIYEIRGLRDDFRSFLDERMKKLESDVAVIKAKLGITS
ncbi:MAG: acylphosphatase [Conexivisphaerales archaeon]